MSAILEEQTNVLFLPYGTIEKLSCNVAVELLPTHTSKSEDSATHPFFAALQ